MTENLGPTTGSNGQSQSDSSVFSEPFSGPFIIEAVALTVSVIGIIGGIIALVHIHSRQGNMSQDDETDVCHSPDDIPERNRR